MKEVITEMTPGDLRALQERGKYEIVVIKYTASWCGPCRTIGPVVEEHFKRMPDNVIYAELDVDIEKNMDLYAVFHKKRMLRGVPAIFVFYGNIEKDFWYAPDDSVCSADVQAINRLFTKVNRKALELQLKSQQR